MILFAEIVGDIYKADYLLDGISKLAKENSALTVEISGEEK